MFSRPLTTIQILMVMALFAFPLPGMPVPGTKGVAAWAQEGQDGNLDEVRIDGLVIDRQKYSFTLQGLGRNYRVMIPNGTPVLMKLNHPKIDLQNRTLQIELMFSSADGDYENNSFMTFPLPDPVFVSESFATGNQFQKFQAASVKNLDRFVLSSSMPETGARPFSFGGELTSSQLPDQFIVNDQGQMISTRLGTRRGLLDGFSVQDFVPLQTSVWVQGQWEGDQLVARRIRFEHLGNPVANFDESLPNCLSLGDLTSFNYHRALVEALRGKINVHHPPVWNGPSKNWDRLHHYVGLIGSDNSRWDVITFNFGLRDHKETRESYQSNLERAIEQLQRTGVQLIWTSSTPIPNGFPTATGSPHDYVSGRMKLQNKWAAEVLKNYPGVIVCDLWQVVEDDANGAFREWWKGRELGFDYVESIPLARRLARYVLAASAASDQEINPMSVHLPAGPNNASK